MNDGPAPAPEEIHLVELVPDELALARAQLDAGLAAIAEGSLRRQIARIEAAGRAAYDELDATRALLAEALWRQQRPLAAGGVLDSVRSSSLERRRPISLIVEAEARAASGDPDRAAALAEQVVRMVGIDEAWRLRGGVPSRVPWPTPPSLRPEPPRAAPPAFAAGAVISPEADDAPAPERIAAAHARLEEARAAFAAGDESRGDDLLTVALRLDATIAGDGVALLEPTLGERPAQGRLVLYGDLLRAAGRDADASAVYDRAARA